MEYENQNVNTINITKNNKVSLDNAMAETTSTSLTSLNNNKNVFAPTNLNFNSNFNKIFYKLQIKNESSNCIISEEFDEIVKKIIDNEDQSFLQGGINLIEYLISKYSGEEMAINAREVESLTLTVKEDFGMFNEFGKYLINLKMLNLSKSGINCISEIGTSFCNLISLNVSHCSVYDLTGI